MDTELKAMRLRWWRNLSPESKREHVLQTLRFYFDFVCACGIVVCIAVLFYWLLEGCPK